MSNKKTQGFGLNLDVATSLVETPEKVYRPFRECHPETGVYILLWSKGCLKADPALGEKDGITKFLGVQDWNG